MDEVMKILSIFTVFLLAISLASAITVKSYNSDSFAPGKEGVVRLVADNVFTQDIENVFLSLDFKNVPLIPTSSSEKSVDKIENDDSETFSFPVKVESNAKPGDYEIPYTIKYTRNNVVESSSGTIGLSIFAQPDLSFTITTDTPVIGQKGKVTLKIVNKGFSDARFVSVNVLPEGFTILSESNTYIGTVSSDDFETATFDVIFNKQFASFDAQVDYTDFNNKKVSKAVSLPLDVYTKQKAEEIGIIKKSNAIMYIGIVILIIVIWIVWRAIAKRRRLKKSLAMNNDRS